MDALGTFIEHAVAFVRTASDRAAEMDGRAAFALGLLTWFLVEQAVRRLAGAVRVAIILAALAGTGIGVAAYLGLGDDGARPGSASPVVR